MKINIKINSKAAFFFYVMALLIFIVFGVSIYNTTVYIQGLVSAGSLTVSGNLKDIILYYCSSCLGYFVYSLLLIALGYIISILQKMSKKENV